MQDYIYKCNEQNNPRSCKALYIYAPWFKNQRNTFIKGSLVILTIYTCTDGIVNGCDRFLLLL